MRGVTSPRSPLQSDVSVADTSPFISAASPTLLNSAVPSSASSTPLFVKSEPTTPLPANDGASVATNNSVTPPSGSPSLTSFISVPGSPLYRRAIESMITVAGMGAHTESELIHCTEQYLAKDLAQFNTSGASVRLLLRTTCRVLLFLGFLIPYSPDSLSTTPFHLPDPSAPALSSSSTQSSTATNSQVETARKTAQSPLYTPSEAVKLAQEGVVGKANWLSERNKNVIYNWVGKKSVELQSKQGTHLPAYSAMLETGSRSTMHNREIGELPSPLLQLLSSPSLSLQQLDQLDGSLQNLLLSSILNRSLHSTPPSPFYSTELRGRESTSQQRVNSRALLGVNRPQIEYVLSGELWKRQKDAIQQKKELEQLHRKERQLWSQFLGRFGIMLHAQGPKKESVGREGTTRRVTRNRDKDSGSSTYPQLSKPLDSNEGDLHIYSRP